MSSFLPVISSNYSLCSRINVSVRNGAFNSKKETLISLANVWLKFCPRQILQFVMEAFGVHINLIAKVGIDATR